ncbi:Bug family tripartite tricarboxylate transporter substrate binding protein, partial [Rhizobium johnstonii]|uniref:Bug family tripartite tricarboxylate transporter substrate binding protein n=1 Tax=Rhizobium johnstonii TaxID=3019933 RepID=UPI003F9558AE
GGGVGAVAVGESAAAADFHDRTINMVVHFAAGGSTDVVARIVAQKMSEDLGQQVIVPNVANAGGNPSSGHAARAEPDGYTILMGTVATHD